MPTTGAASSYLENLVMKWLGRNTAMPSQPSTLYLALFDGVPDDSGLGAEEVDTGNYARLAISTGTSGSGTGSVFGIFGGQLVNSAAVIFPACSGANWGLIAGWALFDSISGGNMLIRGDVSPTATIEIGDTFQFDAGAWNIVMS